MREPDSTRINHRIRIPEIRCIDHNGDQLGVMETRKALHRAMDMGLDLVEISPTARPPVCRIMDYGKYKYETEKKKKNSKKNQAAGKLKEVKFHANVDVHDYDTKIRHARDFLEEGHKVKFSLFFRGRENAHQELGYEVMKKAMVDVADIGNEEQRARLVGRSLIMLVSPKSKK